ncbi:hypothetical protein F503_06042 [Ophiostoma piceae UAMH 11346]|uniref:Uncharacterized protein n=1 Tax=Ophiostoma piceae (strain UAMH 11346) TaxID=1262450 RepID=S3CDD7_OPHP1|nr:hypothetical protein F503_06042 [Ophiostoma piceae UAMH 11346]
MDNNDVGLAAELGHYLQSLDEPKRKLLFACLDCIKAQPSPQDGPLPPNILEVSAFVMSHTSGVDKDTIVKAAAALQAWNKPAIPLGYHIPSSVRAQKKDAPLQGTPLLDGKAISWSDRLKEKAINTGGDSCALSLIRNYEEACQMFSEYASLEFKTVPDNNAADFPFDEAKQRELVTLIYEAIIDMSDILERKPPISLKKANTSSSSVAGDGASFNGSTSSRSPEQSEDPFAASSPPRPVKDTISVSKVKGLSRIEVWLLSWMILFTTHDIHRGRLPFLHWSKTDWGWESSFATFRERLDAVITTLRRSKAAVCSLLESDYKSRLEAHPIREYRRKENNRSQNAERNAQVFVGRHTISTGKVKRNDDGSLCDMEGNIVAPGDADHSGLIEQTLKLCQVGGRVAKSKRDSFECEDAGQPQQDRAQDRNAKHGDRAQQVSSKKRAKKTRTETAIMAAESSNNGSSTSGMTFGFNPATSSASMPKTLAPKPASKPASTTSEPASHASSATAYLHTAPPPEFDWNDDNLIRNLSMYRTSSPGTSPSEVLGLMPSVEGFNDVSIKSDEEPAGDDTDTAAHLPTPSPELLPLTTVPSLLALTKAEPTYPMTPEELPQNESAGDAAVAAVPGLDADISLSSMPYGNIHYAPPGQHLGSFDGMYHSYIYRNSTLPASSSLYNMGIAGSVDAMNAISNCGFLQPYSAGFQPMTSFGSIGSATLDNANTMDDGAATMPAADSCLHGINDTYGTNSSLLFNAVFPQGGIWGVDNAAQGHGQQSRFSLIGTDAASDGDVHDGRGDANMNEAD